MRKVIIYILLIFFLITPINILSKELNVELNSCVDGDTAKFSDGKKIMTVRFLAIDTPETKGTKEQYYGQEASNYTCLKLTNALNITLEFDDNSTLKDKYNRYLAWIFIDGTLLQKDLVTNGYAKVAYLYGDYRYTNELLDAQKDARNKKLGIWQDYQEEANYSIYIFIGLVLIGIIFFIFDRKFRIKVINIFIRTIKKELK